MPCRGSQPVSVAGRAGLRIAASAGGEDHSAVIASELRAKPCDCSILHQKCLNILMAHADIEPPQLCTKCVDDACRLVRLRKDAVSTLCFQLAAARFKPCHHVVRRESIDRAVQKARIARNILKEFLGHTVIRHVAAPFSGDIKLFSEAVVFFKQHHACTALRRCNGRHHPCRAASGDKDLRLIPHAHRHHTHPTAAPDP